MESKVTSFVSWAGCLVSIVGLVVALLMYPRAKWLLLLPLAIVVLFVLGAFFKRQPDPRTVGDFVERLLNGEFGGYDVDDYEILKPRDAALRDLWRKTMEVGGSPEEWVRLDDERKNELRGLAQQMKRLDEEKGE